MRLVARHYMLVQCVQQGSLRSHRASRLYQAQLLLPAGIPPLTGPRQLGRSDRLGRRTHRTPPRQDNSRLGALWES